MGLLFVAAKLRSSQTAPFLTTVILMFINVSNVKITIAGTKFYQGRSNTSSGGLHLVNSGKYNLNITNCEFNGSKGYGGSHMMIESRPFELISTLMGIKIESSSFTAGSVSSGVTIETTGSEFETLTVTLKNCTFSKNEDTSLHIYNARYIIIEKSVFEGDKGFDGCSVLCTSNLANITLRDSNISNNTCSGIRLVGSRINFEGVINISGNNGSRGGAIWLGRKIWSGYGGLPFSELILKNTSEVYIINNSAVAYGGGVYSDETCKERNAEKKCFFQFEGNHTS